MGLLERALKLKREINKRGGKTLIDKIKGPAETEMLEEDVEERREEVDIDEFVEVGIPGEEREKDVDLLILKEDELIAIDEDDNDDDDLFDLPEDDGQSLDDTLDAHKKRIDEPESVQMETPVKEKKSPVEAEYKDEPFGMDDEPVLIKGKEEKSLSTAKGDDISNKEKEFKSRIRKKRKKIESDSAEPGDDQIAEGTFNDYMVLYEIEKEITRSDSKESLFDVILFSLMGQTGASSSLIIVKDSKDDDKWSIAEARGIKIEEKNLEFNKTEGILEQLFLRKEIIDIEEFSKDKEYNDDYVKFISIDARLLAPLVIKEEMLGVVVLGDKITSDEYQDIEKDFINSIVEVSAIALRNLSLVEDVNKKINDISSEFDSIHDVDNLLEKIISEAGIEQVENIIKNEFMNMGVESYSLFIKKKNDDSYIPFIVEENDHLSLKKNEFNIPDNSDLVKYILNTEAPIVIDNFKKSKYITEIFTEEHIDKMSMFRVYPFITGKILLGFAVIYRVDESIKIEEVDSKMLRIARFIFSYIICVQSYDHLGNRYVDNIETIFKRIEEEIKNAKNLGIPLTLVLFSIKNFKRYYNLFGNNVVQMLLEKFEKIIRGRLSDNDFSVRYDRHKIMIVLPGKDKKYAIPLANSIRNEIVQTFSEKEMPLLVTSLTAEYPEDGEDLYNLIDTID